MSTLAKLSLIVLLSSVMALALDAENGLRPPTAGQRNSEKSRIGVGDPPFVDFNVGISKNEGQNLGGKDTDKAKSSGQSSGPKPNNQAAPTNSNASNSGSDSGGGAQSGGGPKGGGGGGAPISTPGGGVQSGGNAKAFPLWYPMCLFMDSAAVSQSQGNQTVKALTDGAADCEVNLVVFPIAIKPGYPNDEAAINSAQQSACNVVGLNNATRASTSTCVTYDDTADAMCKSYEGDPPKLTKDVAGCAQLQSGGKNKIADYVKRLRDEGKRTGDAAKLKKANDIEKHMQGGDSAGGVAAPSIEDNGSCDVTTVGHEALGHSMWGHPNGAGDGNGIDDLTGSGTTGAGNRGGWTANGCQAMRENAFSNDGRWKYDPNRQTYYTLPKNPELQFDLMSGKPLFKNQTSPPPGLIVSEPPKSTPVNRVIVEVVDGEPKGSGGTKTMPVGTTPVAPPTGPGEAVPEMVDADVRHRRRPQGPLDLLLSSVKTTLGMAEPEEFFGPGARTIVGPPPPPGKGSPVARIGFDDTAKKNTEGGGSSLSSSVAKKGVNRTGTGDGYTVDSNPAGVDFAESSLNEGTSTPALLSSSGGLAPSGSGQRSATVTFDDSAQKIGATSGGISSPGRSSGDVQERVSDSGLEPMRQPASGASYSFAAGDEFFDEVAQSGPKSRARMRVKQGLGSAAVERRGARVPGNATARPGNTVRGGRNVYANE